MRLHIPFVKMQAIGNDFVLLDERTVGRLDYAILAQRMCDRHTGIGSDGLLIVSRSSKADFLFRMFNPDGTEDTCGNGLRCAVKYWIESRTRLKEGNIGLSVEHRRAVRSVRAFVRKGKVRLVTAEMGVPSFDPRVIPLATDHETIDKPVSVGTQSFRMTCVNTGTANAVIFVNKSYLARPIPPISPQIETHPLFPERANVLWAYVSNRSRIEAAVWERSVGETLGCGTGACAAAAAAMRLGLTGRKVTVVFRGGKVQVDWPEDGNLLMTGGAEEIFRGTWTATT